MTPERIQAMVAVIEAERGDPETAHGLEDDLYLQLIQYIAETAPLPWSLLAQEALKSEALDFPRWCA